MLMLGHRYSAQSNSLGRTWIDHVVKALAGAVHNVDRSRTPVVIYAGASAFSADGEHKGTRNEWIMWIQGIWHQYPSG